MDLHNTVNLAITFEISTQRTKKIVGFNHLTWIWCPLSWNLEHFYTSLILPETTPELNFCCGHYKSLFITVTAQQALKTPIYCSRRRVGTPNIAEINIRMDSSYWAEPNNNSYTTYTAAGVGTVYTAS